MSMDENWIRAEKSIPGGNGLLSKRPDRYAPDVWPAYFEMCKGVNVTDLNGNIYTDMAQMGIGTSILGYAPEELVTHISEVSAKGVNCTLNCIEELELAEKLLELNPFAGGVKFAKTGAEAMAIAIRIARASVGRSKVAFSGYHGWMDWYLATNIAGEGLKDHLLPGLSTAGIPSQLLNTIVPFKYNDVNDLSRVLDENPDIGVICIEGARYDFPTEQFLASVTQHAKKLNAVIVSDEITSGWRMTSGGVYLLNGFEPDIVVYAKAMGGGYPISAVVGKSSVMDAAKNTFISSTMWTERIGFAAALKTIQIMLRDTTWSHLIKIGQEIGDGWARLSTKHELRLEVTEFKPLITFKFGYGVENDKILTLFTQEMLKRGYLAAASVYVSAAHTSEIVEEYLFHVDAVFETIAKSINAGTLDKALQTRCRSDSFKRLNS